MAHPAATDNSSNNLQRIVALAFVVLLIGFMLLLHYRGKAEVEKKNSVLAQAKQTTETEPELGSIELSIDGSVKRLKFDRRKTDSVMHIICDNGEVVDLQYIPSVEN